MTDKFINTGIINSYKLLVGEKTMDEIVAKTELPIFFINPEIDDDYDNEDLDTMIDYFVSTEEYEKCAILTKLKI
jgi:hypothetical protein|tara:strand:- start:192 stop:416 length:225 start_codon:yes stop_codon:yes gene_type:complete